MHSRHDESAYPPRLPGKPNVGNPIEPKLQSAASATREGHWKTTGPARTLPIMAGHRQSNAVFGELVFARLQLTAKEPGGLASDRGLIYAGRPWFVAKVRKQFCNGRPFHSEPTAAMAENRPLTNSLLHVRIGSMRPGKQARWRSAAGAEAVEAATRGSPAFCLRTGGISSGPMPETPRPY